MTKSGKRGSFDTPGKREGPGKTNYVKGQGQSSQNNSPCVTVVVGNYPGSVAVLGFLWGAVTANGTKELCLGAGGPRIPRRS